MAVALMTRGPLTAYSIFLMQGFMFSTVTVAAVDMLALLWKLLRETRSLCLKLILIYTILDSKLMTMTVNQMIPTHRR